jgi:predicted cupin superfamily sugar epimerase
MIRTAPYWIDKLQLTKHPEGGYYREVYRSDEFVHKKNLPDRYSSFRSFSTSIYFLLESHEFSAFHRLKSDEIWHFYEGSAITILMIDQHGEFRKIILGRNQEKDEVFQAIIPKGCWFAAYVKDHPSFALVGCTVAPGFDFEDFEMGKKEELYKLFPELSAVINQFCHL